MRKVDVVVAGGGPVGLCLASLLARAGLEVTIVEADATPPHDLRASTFHPPTLEMLEQLEVTAEMLAQGVLCPHWQIRLHPAGDRAVFDLGLLADETPHPYRLQCEQWRLSDDLRARLEGRVETLRGTRVVGFVQDGSGVTVELDSNGTKSQIRGRYLAGCDGGSSAVRRALGLAFEGDTYPDTMLLATTDFPFEEHLEGLSNVSYCWCEGAGNFSLLKVPGRWRVSGYPSEDLPIDDQMTPEALDASLQAIVPRPVPYEILECRPFRVHMRIVSQYRIGRVVLAGDAAHVNSPSGGMGLNGGIHDAFELAPALIAILRDEGDERLLDRYDARRRPIARDEILSQADRNRARMRERDPERRRELLAELQALTVDPVRCKEYLLRSSMIVGLRRAATLA